MARAIARERGIDLRTIHGSGPGGRVIRADVEAQSGNGRAAAAPASATPPGSAGVPPAPAAQPASAAAPSAPPAAAPAPPGERPPAAPQAAAGDDVEVRPVGRVHQVMAERTLQSVRDIPQY